MSAALCGRPPGPGTKGSYFLRGQMCRPGFTAKGSDCEPWSKPHVATSSCFEAKNEDNCTAADVAKAGGDGALFFLSWRQCDVLTYKHRYTRTLRTYMHVCINACMCVCDYVCVCVSLCVCLCACEKYPHKHKHKHKHEHKHQKHKYRHRHKHKHRHNNRHNHNYIQNMQIIRACRVFA